MTDGLGDATNAAMSGHGRDVRVQSDGIVDGPPADATAETWRSTPLRIALFVLSGVLLVAVSLATGLAATMRVAPLSTVAAHASLFVVCLLLWLVALQASLKRTGVILLTLALAARLAMLPFPASDDVNRYLWEGSRVLAGESPYHETADQAPVQWRDAHWVGMNNKDKLTAYPPLAELVFAALVAIDDDPWPMKIAFTLAEMGVLVLLWRELRRRGLPEAHLALFAANPISLLATAGEAHFDALLVLALVMTVLAVARGRAQLAWAALAAAIQLKLVAVLLLPLVLLRLGWAGVRRGFPLFLLVMVIPALPFASDLPNLLAGVLAFGGGTFHDGFVPALLRHVITPSAATSVAACLLVLWTGLVVARVRDPARHGFLVMAGLLLLSPVTHYWYFLWVLPFLVLAPQPAWLLLCGMLALYPLTWRQLAETGVWAQPAWAWWAQWLPVALVLAASAWPTARRLFNWAQPFEQNWPRPQSISVIIPTWHEADRIGDCIEAVKRTGVREVIVVDGGSDDGTLGRAEAAGARAILGPRGRGRQIAAGLGHATGDVIWIMHADARPHPDSCRAIFTALATEPAIAGGALGQCFDRVSPALLLIEALNAQRSILFALSFGDQGQFFRRASLPTIGGFPDLPLMEDVELALRLRRVGPILHLGRNNAVSSRRWDQERALQRAITIVRFTIQYLFSRNRQNLSAQLFRRYYRAN